jgi:lantibiotic modifying enzyme
MEHFANPGMYYAHGFLGAAAMEAYLEIARQRLGLGSSVLVLPPDPPTTFCSAWGGFGAQLILSQLAIGAVSERLWRRFSLAITHTQHTDFYQGADGTLPVLAALAGTRGEGLVRLIRLAHRRTVQRLRARLVQNVRGIVGLAHGFVGTLLAYEIGCALLGNDGAALRHRAIAKLRAWAVSTPAGAIWSDRSDSTSSHMHGLCSGAPGVCFAALLGYRYSGDDAYVPLIDQSIATVPLHTTAESLCCGTLGRVEVLIEAYRTTNDEQYLDLARQLPSRSSATWTPASGCPRKGNSTSA